ncbi:hypothetical protein P9D14_12770 [Bacillus velezensis]|uniref:hypothetical protein n=1 Tax=Bacillus velezensis TaxID=492670 RepID=UPI002DBA430A|nr:hypothetical protein [Bacillus velezensis]MEC1384389.1 hypothetical protein [Bacillus velezensis]
MAKYRKKAPEIEAVKWGGITKDSTDNLRKFIGDEAYKERCFVYPSSDKLEIKTPSSEIVAQVGDYIIRGIEGEYYPCRSDIFEKTYEKVDGN